MSDHHNCLFCKIIAGAIPSEQLYQDDQLIVIKDKYPKAPTHLLIIPREHIVSLNEIESRHANLMSHIFLKVKEIAKIAGLTDGFRTIVNTGAGGGQEIFHLHIHILGTKAICTN